MKSDKNKVANPPAKNPRNKARKTTKSRSPSSDTTNIVKRRKIDGPPVQKPVTEVFAEDLDDVDDDGMKLPARRTSNSTKESATFHRTPAQVFNPQFKAEMTNLLRKYNLPSFAEIFSQELEYKSVDTVVQPLPLFVDIIGEKVFFRTALVKLPTTIGTGDGFLEKLNKKVEELELVRDGNLVDEKLVDLVCDAIGGAANENGIWHAKWRATRVAISTNMLQLDLDLARNCGEMFLQQTVFSPVAELFSCFKVSMYCADKMVQCAHVLGCAHDTKTTYQVACMPDAALRLAEKFYIGAMMEINDCNADPRSQMHDEHKSILMTCMSILALQEYLSKHGLLHEQKRFSEEENCEERDLAPAERIQDVDSLTTKKLYAYDDIAIPFVLAQHDIASLYVTRVLSPHEGPVVSQLMETKFTNLDPAEKEEKANFMAMLAILVADVYKISREHFRMNRYFHAISLQNKTAQKVNSLSKPKRSKLQRASGSEGSNRDAANESKHEDSARQVASWNGQVQNLIHLLPKVGKLFFVDVAQWQADREYYQQESPFYFKGFYHSKAVFCKVWREGDLRTERNGIIEEIMFHQKANENDVPSSKVVQDLTSMDVTFPVQSNFSTVYHILVTEYHRSEAVAEQDIFKFAKSLVQAVLKLHKIGILHCDIKPNNVLWDSQEKVTRLIDFGHAQYIQNAWSYPVTKGYEAPEISENQPHSKMSDAYGVGRTLEEICGRFKSAESKNIQKLAKMLQLDLSKRLPLEEAEAYIATMGNGKSISNQNCNLQHFQNGQSITITLD